jgi:hypothetical protein
MDNIFLLSGVITIIFFIAKFLEMRYIDKEAKPLKLLIRDALVVFVSIVFGNYIIEQVNPVLGETISITQASPAVFTDNPPF